jgi:aspartyl protease family protein
MFYKTVFGAIGAGLVVGFLAPSQPPVIPQTHDGALILTPQTKAPQASNSNHGFETVLQRQSDGHFYADVLVNGQRVHFLVDTGASAIALTSEDGVRVGLPANPSEYEVVASGASGDVMGKFVTVHHVQLDNKEAWDLRGAVLGDGLRVSLLGQNFLARIGSVEIKGDQMILR